MTELQKGGETSDLPDNALPFKKRQRETLENYFQGLLASGRNEDFSSPSFITNEIEKFLQGIMWTPSIKNDEEGRPTLDIDIWNTKEPGILLSFNCEGELSHVIVGRSIFSGLCPGEQSFKDFSGVKPGKNVAKTFLRFGESFTLAREKGEEEVYVYFKPWKRGLQEEEPVPLSSS